MTTAAEMKKTTLYEVGVEGAEIEAILLENDGELTPELEARLDAHLASGKNKIVAAAMVVRQLEGSEAACDAEIKRLVERKASWARQKENLKARMLFAVDLGFDGKVKTDLFTVWGQTSPPVVAFELKPEAEIQEVMEHDPSLVRITFALNKTELAAKHKAGEPLPEAILVEEREGTRFLRIK